MSLLYQPVNRLKPVADDIWVVDGDLVSFYGIPFSTRMTVVRLSSGDIWLHSPVAATPDLRAAIAALGSVRHLVSPNHIHYWFIPDWKEQFPDAVAWASPGVAKRARKRRGFTFDRDLTDTPDPAWAADLHQVVVRGSPAHSEVAFFHIPSRSLILTDLIENFEPQRLGPWKRRLMGLVGIVDPDGRMPLDMRLTFLFGHKRLRAAIRTMLRWEPERLILAHGRWYDSHGEAELRRAFRWLI